jgi:hypothetical protein
LRFILIICGFPRRNSRPSRSVTKKLQPTGIKRSAKDGGAEIVGETREKLQKLRQESDPRVQEIRAQNDENLQRVLTPEQWQRFQLEREKIRQTEKPPAPPKQLNLH